MKKHTLRFISVVLSITLTFLSGIPAGAYSFSATRKETPQDLNDFLDSCSDLERVQMLQALAIFKPKDGLGWFPSKYKLKDEYFGTLKGLPSLNNFVTDAKKATASRPMKPETFNEVLPETVLDAINRGILERYEISHESIRKALVWRAYNKTTYYFRSDDEVDYHGIVQWAAGKAGVDSKHVENLPTYTLEHRIAEKYFETIWNGLTPEQRLAVLNNIEKESGKLIPNKSSVASMTGAAALGALQVAVNIMGFGFYTMMSSTIATVAALVGVKLPFIVYTTASHWAALLAGPIGWAIEAAIIGATVFFLGSAEKETVSAFIMTVNMIKAKRYMND